jgi:aminoglycoside phosphotransferase (APT) family kinase protein
MIDAQAQFSGTRPVAPRHAFNIGALRAWMRAHVPGFEGALEVEQFKGGQSNPTFRLTAGARRYVLRRKPAGTLLPSAHAVEREFRVMQALAATGVPVPRMRALCDDFGLARAWASTRTLRFADGADERHRNAIAKMEFTRHQEH